jgi:hypothetical protein
VRVDPRPGALNPDAGPRVAAEVGVRPSRLLESWETTPDA